MTSLSGSVSTVTQGAAAGLGGAVYNGVGGNGPNSVSQASAARSIAYSAAGTLAGYALGLAIGAPTGIGVLASAPVLGALGGAIGEFVAALQDKSWEPAARADAFGAAILNLALGGALAAKARLSSERGCLVPPQNFLGRSPAIL